MTDKTLEASRILDKKGIADFISEQWDSMNSQRTPWLSEKQELRDYVFATDTSTTSNADLPWKNKTTLPKLCQIRDNLHANYISALFPNDDWMKWEGYSIKDEEKKKRAAINAYMGNKVRESGMRNTVSALLYDYIDYGIAIGDVVWSNESKIDVETGETIAGYIGPKLIRRSPQDVIFDATATTFEESWKITRTLKNFGEFKLDFKDNQEEWVGEVIKAAEDARIGLSSFTRDDFNKASSYSVDGFGDLYEYYGSGFIEILEFEGTLHDPETGEVLDDYIVTVIDRNKVVRKEPIPAWKRGGHKVFTSWRKRPDNLYGMGPLDNLVGMQYRLDHLENLKADIFDLIAAPPLKIIGDVDEFEWKPFAEIHIAEGGDVIPLAPNTQALAANNEIAALLSLMEEFAGAPKQAMGVRTPGEKTAFEVQALENAAGRIFQEKTTQFEIELLEPALNNMLEVASRQMDSADMARVMDDDLGVAKFVEITKHDITAKGKLRAVGARHFAARSQLIQNLTGIASSPIWAKVERHFSDKALAKLVEDSLQLQRFSLVSDNVALFEQQEAQRLQGQMQEDLEVEQTMPLEGGQGEPPLA